MTEDIRPGCLPDCKEGWRYTNCPPATCPVCDQAKTAMVNEARASLELYMNAPPAQMTYNGGLVSINADGMRYVIDDATALREELRKAQADHDYDLKRLEAELRKAREERTLESLAAAEGEDVAGFLMKRGYSKWETERREARAGAFEEAIGLVQAVKGRGLGSDVKDAILKILQANEREAAGKSEGAQALPICVRCNQPMTIHQTWVGDRHKSCEAAKGEWAQSTARQHLDPEPCVGCGAPVDRSRRLSCGQSACIEDAKSLLAGLADVDAGRTRSLEDVRRDAKGEEPR